MYQCAINSLGTSWQRNGDDWWSGFVHAPVTAACARVRPEWKCGIGLYAEQTGEFLLGYTLAGEFDHRDEAMTAGEAVLKAVHDLRVPPSPGQVLAGYTLEFATASEDVLTFVKQLTARKGERRR